MRLKPVVSVVGLAALAACQGGSDIEELKKGQKDILAKLDSLDKQVKAGAPAAARPQQPDPNKVYNIPIADSVVRGPKTAKVTIVEFSDFQ
jgi:protein-disulfide isomerase